MRAEDEDLDEQLAIVAADSEAIDARDGVVKVASAMADQRSPLLAVTKNGTLHGVLTATQVLAAALKS